jgi:hypothetical protein
MGFWSNLVRRAPHNGEWNAVFDQTGTGAGVPLGTARWMAPESALEKFCYSTSSVAGRVWVGEASIGRRALLATRTIGTSAL